MRSTRSGPLWKSQVRKALRHRFHDGPSRSSICKLKQFQVFQKCRRLYPIVCKIGTSSQSQSRILLTPLCRRNPWRPPAALMRSPPQSSFSAPPPWCRLPITFWLASSSSSSSSITYWSSTSSGIFSVDSGEIR